MKDLNAVLRASATAKHKAFSEKLIPTVAPETILGVPMPALRKLAKGVDRSFLADLPHGTYEENILHSLLINDLPAEEALRAMDAFVPYLDNWAVVDALDPRAFYKGDYIEDYIRLMKSPAPYGRRLGIVLALRHVKEDPERLMEAVEAAESGHYYVDMAMAWFFAEAALYEAEAVLRRLEEGALPASVHKKTIRKIKESRRVPPAVKDRASALQ